MTWCSTQRRRREAATDRLALLRKQHAKAVRDSERAAQARADLPPGSSRARVTSANAKWARLAEHRDRLAAEIAALEELG